MKLRCRLCGTAHKARFDKFPMGIAKRQEVFTGRGLRRKSLGIKQVIVGYLCEKCAKKQRREQAKYRQKGVRYG